MKSNFLREWTLLVIQCKHFFQYYLSYMISVNHTKKKKNQLFSSYPLNQSSLMLQRQPPLTNLSSQGQRHHSNPNAKLFNVNTSNVKKLTSTNYSLQIHDFLHGYDLSGFHDGISAIPNATIIVNKDIVVNPEFSFWKRQDKLIFSAWLGAIFSLIQPVVHVMCHNLNKDLAHLSININN